MRQVKESKKSGQKEEKTAFESFLHCLLVLVICVEAEKDREMKALVFFCFNFDFVVPFSSFLFGVYALFLILLFVLGLSFRFFFFRRCLSPVSPLLHFAVAAAAAAFSSCLVVAPKTHGTIPFFHY